MNPVKKNIVANFAGSIWQGIMSLVFIPLYIKFMGVESWGLIGFFATLQAVFSLLDMGLSSTLTREMARLSILPDKKQEMRNLVRTMEIIYWSIAVLAGSIIAASSSFIVHHWVKAGELPTQTIEQAILIMGFVMALQMPIGFYSGGLMGLQKQVTLNVVNISVATLRGVGAVLILWLVSPTIQAFFLWQIATSSINIFLLALFLWRRLPSSNRKAIFQKQLLKGIWKFAAGISGISIFAIILSQLDKIVLSKMLSLEMFGYYMLASVVAMSLTRFFTPVFHSVYPRFTQLVSIGDQEGLKQLYHKSCQFMSILILPIAIIIALFSYEIILIWTQNPVTAEKTHLLVSILICGTAINGLMNLPYALQLASGWTQLSIFKNIFAVLLVIPLIIYMSNRYGATGASCVWLILHTTLFLFEIPIMHCRLLCEEKWRWYLQDIGVPFLSCLLVASLGRTIITGLTYQPFILLSILLIAALTLATAIMVTPASRVWTLEKLSIIKSIGSKRTCISNTQG